MFRKKWSASAVFDLKSYKMWPLSLSPLVSLVSDVAFCGWETQWTWWATKTHFKEGTFPITFRTTISTCKPFSVHLACLCFVFKCKQINKHYLTWTAAATAKQKPRTTSSLSSSTSPMSPSVALKFSECSRIIFSPCLKQNNVKRFPLSNPISPVLKQEVYTTGL